jgi:hypothetical protein
MQIAKNTQLNSEPIKAHDLEVTAGIKIKAFGTRMNVIEEIAPISNRPRARESNPNKRSEARAQLKSLIMTILSVTFVLAKTLVNT